MLSQWTSVQSVAVRCKKRHLYSAVVELPSTAEVQKLISLQSSLVQSPSASIPGAADLLKFVLTPLSVSAEVESRVPDVSLNEAEVLAKMRRVAGNR